MRRALILIVVGTLWLGIVSGASAEAERPVIDAAALAQLQLPFAGTQAQRDYLGIPSEPALTLAQIKAKSVIIVILNSFCTICQADAPILNAVFQMIEENPALQGNTKLVGIAAGNTRAEVQAFQQEYNVLFPLIADPDFHVDQAIPKNLRTPMLITANIIEGKSLEVVETHLGEVKDVDALLRQPIRSAMLKKPERSVSDL